MEKSNTWTVTAELQVFAGDMSKEEVMKNTEAVLADITDGTDIAGFGVRDARRNPL